MIKLYTAQTPNGRKVSIALEELGLDYEVEWVNLQEQQQFRCLQLHWQHDGRLDPVHTGES